MKKNSRSRPRKTLYDPRPQDKQYLKVRAVSLQVYKERGYQPISAERAKREGFPALAGMYIPRYGVDGKPAPPQLRPDKPRLRDGKPAKFEAPYGSANFIDAHPWVHDRLRVDPKGWAADPSTTALVITGTRRGDKKPPPAP